jgi:hypothetical protein
LEREITNVHEGGVNFVMKAYRAVSSILLAGVLAGAGSAVTGVRRVGAGGQRPAGLAAYPTRSAEAVIAAHWMAFFNPKTSVARRISLLQGGEQFATVIRSRASSSLAAHASAEVTSVTLVSATRAKVVYTLREDGKPARANLLGVAVYQDGTWKVGVSTFCSLLAMENGGRTSSLPTACKATPGT